jgi:hypothetical protein
MESIARRLKRRSGVAENMESSTVVSGLEINVEDAQPALTSGQPEFPKKLKNNQSKIYMANTSTRNDALDHVSKFITDTSPDFDSFGNVLAEKEGLLLVSEKITPSISISHASLLMGLRQHQQPVRRGRRSRSDNGLSNPTARAAMLSHQLTPLRNISNTAEKEDASTKSEGANVITLYDAFRPKIYGHLSNDEATGTSFHNITDYGNNRWRIERIRYKGQSSRAWGSYPATIYARDVNFRIRLFFRVRFYSFIHIGFILLFALSVPIDL